MLPNEQEREAFRNGILIYMELEKKPRRKAGQTYRGDKVAAFLWAGFYYPALCSYAARQVSEELAPRWGQDEDSFELVSKALDAIERERGIDEYTRKPGANYKPFTVQEGGETWTIPGVKIYLGENRDPHRGASHGDIYVEGLKLGSKVLVPGDPYPEGEPRTKTAIITRKVREESALGAWRRYSATRLESFAVGEEAARRALTQGLGEIPADLQDFLQTFLS